MCAGKSETEIKMVWGYENGQERKRSVGFMNPLRAEQDKAFSQLVRRSRNRHLRETLSSCNFINELANPLCGRHNKQVMQYRHRGARQDVTSCATMQRRVNQMEDSSLNLRIHTQRTENTGIVVEQTKLRADFTSGFVSSVDRGRAILPSGHSFSLCFWYDSKNMITCSEHEEAAERPHHKQHTFQFSLTKTATTAAIKDIYVH